MYRYRTEVQVLARTTAPQHLEDPTGQLLLDSNPNSDSDPRAAHRPQATASLT